MQSAHAIVEDEVRELVRRRGIDPLAEPAVVARLVEEVVGDYRDRSITSSLPPMGDAAAASRAVLDAVSGFGPLQPLLDDPSVEEIWIKCRLTWVLWCHISSADVETRSELSGLVRARRYGRAHVGTAHGRQLESARPVTVAKISGLSAGLKAASSSPGSASTAR